MGLIIAELLSNSHIISFPMPEDARVQQQVHMHIWMEADIIMVIVSDVRRAVNIAFDLLGCKVWIQRIKKSTSSRRGALRRKFEAAVSTDSAATYREEQHFVLTCD
jgi:hypothetical protein